MLQIVTSMRALDFASLMDIYEEGNRENGRENYPREPEEVQRFLAEQDFHQYLRECFFTTPGAFYALWKPVGIAVSALRMEPYRDGLLLAALETAPAHRKKGHAAALIQAVLAEVGDRKIYSHVSKRNKASLRTHEVCGFRKILDYAVYADGSVLQSSVTLCYEP